MNVLKNMALLFSLSFLVAATCRAQDSATEWDALLTQTEGWLGADGIYSLDLNYDSEASLFDANKSDNQLSLFWFSDTICGKTKKNGAEYAQWQMINHSFAILKGNAPDKEKIEFFLKSDSSIPGPKNIVSGHYWLQDGIRLGNRLWISAILVGDAWKPKRVDAVTIGLNEETKQPNFSDVVVDVNAPLSFKTDEAQVVWGAAICDDADQQYIYIYGYVDRLKEWSRKDMVAARAPRDSFLKYDQWQYFDGQNWTNEPEAVLKREAALVRAVSTEFSVSKIPYGPSRDKYLLVYTPNVIGERIAYRSGDSPVGPFDEEVVFYQSDIPRNIQGVKCYNAKAHPIFADKTGVLVSYNVNRLGDIAKKPEEYRPRFVWLNWETINAPPSSQNTSEN